MVFAVVQAQALEDVTDVCHPFLSSIRMLAAICLDPQAGVIVNHAAPLTGERA